MDHMCTIQAARIIIPGHESYGLKNITKDLGISLTQHHRAIDDTLATAELFKILYANAGGNFTPFIKKEI